MIYEQIFQKLNEENIDYIVIGGVALVLHGVIRLTVDLDLILLPRRENLRRFVLVMKSLGYKPKLPDLPEDLSFEILKFWKEKRNLQVLSFFDPKDPFKLIDILIEPVVNYEDVLKDKKVISLGKIKVPIISINNLKKLKKETNRPKDLEDIASLDKLASLEREEDE